MLSDAEAIRRRVERLTSLPTLPGIVEKLAVEVEDEQASAEEIGRMISADQVLSAKVLRLVNSAYYGFPGRISTVTHALVLLGFNVIKGLVLSAAVLDMMKEGVAGLWEHSCACSLIAGRLSTLLELEAPEEVAVAALIHDLGKVIICVELPQEFQRIQSHQRMARCSLREAEEEILHGVNHADIAGWLGDEWRLPARLIEPIRYHHAPASSQFAPRQTAVVHLADILTRAHCFGYGGDPLVPPIEPRALESLGIRLSDLEDMIMALPAELEELDVAAFG
ncbi:HDOD domain-containing protein [Candidatus Sumerlaeota bacterium]|nr:HDOD domain-containing protein [Candidatus Sumerlaeota bacterium]